MKNFFKTISPFCIVVLLFFGTHAAHAAIVFDNAADSSYSNNGTLTWTHFATSTANTIVFVGLEESIGSTVSSVTYASSTMTLIAKQSDPNVAGSGATDTVYLYYLLDPPSGSSTITASFTNSGADYVEGGSVSYAGVAQTEQPDNFTTNDVNVTSSYSNQYTTLTTHADNSWGIEMALDNGIYSFSSVPSVIRTSVGGNGALLDTNGPTTPPGPMSINASPESTGQEIMVMASFAPYVAPPNQPQSLTATPSNNEVTLNWSAPSGGGAPSSYLVYDKITASSTYNFYASTTVVSPSSIVTGLTNGINYSFEVFSDNSSGTSTPATATSTPEPGPPDPPQSLTATPSLSQVALSWAAPVSNGGSTITEYLVYDGLTASSSFSLYATTTLSQMTSVVTGLLNNQGYSFQVFAQNVYGTSTAATVSATPSNFATSTTVGGNWSATSSWVGGVVPGDGYYVTIQGPVVIDQNIGTVGGGGIKNITVTGPSTILSVNTSSPRTILFGSTGSNPEGSGTATAPGQDANMYGFFVMKDAQLLLTGTASDPVTIEAANDTSPIFFNGNTFYTGTTTLPSGNLRLVYDDIYNLGANTTSSDCSTTCFPGINWAQSGNETLANFIDIEHSRFTSPYQIISTPGSPELFTFSSNYITGQWGEYALYQGAGAFGGEVVADNTEVSPAMVGNNTSFFFYSPSDPGSAQFLRNAISGTTSTAIGFLQDGAALNGGDSTTIQYNLVYNYPNGITYGDYSGFGDTKQNTLALAGNSLIDSNVSENNWSAFLGGGIISNNYAFAIPSLSQGILFVQGASDTIATHNVFVYASTSPFLAGSFDTFNWATTTGEILDHNTLIGSSNVAGPPSESSGIIIGDGGGSPTYNNIIRSNIVTNNQYGITAAGGGSDTFANDYNGAGVDHNDVYDNAYSAYVEQTGTVGFDNGTISHPNAIYGDIATDPQFFDPSRISILNYDSRVLGGPGTAADLFTQLGYRSGWGGNYASTTLALDTPDGNPINDIRKWLFAGYAPTDLAIATSGADGLPDGAEDMGLTSISPSTLPNGTTSVPYSQLLTATGDSAPYTWSVSSGTLPTGLSLATSSTNSTTTISGTPTGSGASNFTIEVQGSMGTNITQNYNVTIGSTGATVPSAPQSLVATPGNAQVALSWLAPASNGSSSLTQYDVWDKLTASSSYTEFATTTPPKTTSTVTSLANGANYSFEVFAENSVGSSSASNVATGTPSTVPSAPTIGTATPGNAQASVTFTPNSNGGSAVLYYTAASNPSNISATSSGSPVLVTGLANGQSYTFTVTATNVNGTSAASGASGSATPSAALSSISPTTLPTSTATVAYSQVLTANGGLTPYTWSISAGTLPMGLSLATSSTNGTTTISGTPTIVGTSTFTVEVQSGGASTTQVYTFDVAAPTIPTAPQSLAATPGDNQVALTWSAPVSNGGASISQYLVYDRTTGSPTFAQYATTTASTMSATVIGLTDGTSYDFEVLAKNSVGTSTPSSIVSATPVVPSSPTVYVAAGGGGGGTGVSVFPPVTTTASSSTSSVPETIASLQAELSSLEAQLNVLLVQASGQTGTNISSASGSPFVFTHDLQVNTVDPEVANLQRYLNTHGSPMALAGYGSLGQEIDRFGQRTYTALVKFQASVGIRATGYFGIITRGYMNSHP